MATLAIVSTCRDNNSWAKTVKVAGEVAAGFTQNSSPGLTELISSVPVYIHTVSSHVQMAEFFLPSSQFLSAEEQTDQTLLGIVPKQMPCPTLGGNDAVQGGACLTR